MSRSHRHQLQSRGLTLIETVIALALIGVLLAILVPALAAARVTSHRDQCGDNLRTIGAAWQSYLADHNDEFPYVPLQPAWHSAGMRFSRIDGTAFPDYNRPLTQYLNVFKTRDYAALCVCCPADRGISAAAAAAGTGDRTAFESYGNSYRAVAPIFDARLLGITEASRGMRRGEITTPPSKLLLCGDAVWYEVVNSTGRHADWHGEPNAGNLLLLDGSVRYWTLRPRGNAVSFDPLVAGMSAAPASASAPASAPDDEVPQTSPDAPPPPTS